ncbi:MAG: hypothetical protein EBS90_12595 [Betaproteobacteria bacterium]|nr:hypothetical protein [Betaproteobacteria bacterium]
MDLAAYLPNAKPWIEKALNNNWQALSSVVPPEMMPSQERLLKSGRMTFAKEYGCGVYGCVLPTGKKDVVFKMTTDATEASFVAAMMTMRGLPEGLVRYHAVVELPEKKGRDKIFALWREEARDIGFLLRPASQMKAPGFSEEEISRALNGFKEDLALFKESAEKVLQYYVDARLSRAAIQALEVQVRSVEAAWKGQPEGAANILAGVDPRKIKGAALAAFNVAGCVLDAWNMSANPLGNTVGDALLNLINQGYVLADVHYNNVGIVDRPNGDTVIAITDPGHAIPLKEKWWKFPVPHLMDRDAATTRRLVAAAN